MLIFRKEERFEKYWRKIFRKIIEKLRKKKEVKGWENRILLENIWIEYSCDIWDGYRVEIIVHFKGHITINGELIVMF